MTVHTTDCTSLSVCRCRPEIMSNARFGAIGARRSEMLASSTINVCIKHTASTELASTKKKVMRKQQKKGSSTKISKTGKIAYLVGNILRTNLISVNLT